MVPARNATSSPRATGTRSAVRSSRSRRRSAVEESKSPGSELGSVRAPARGAFVSGPRGEHARLVEGAAGELEGQRIALAAEAAAHRRGRLAGDVERHGERGLAEEVEDPI